MLFSAFSSNISALVTNTRLQSENKNLTAIANSDFLTNLPSRRAFLQRVNILPAIDSVIVPIGDLDDFKHINDCFGHPAGDYVLQTVGRLIRTYCGSHSLPCRWGCAGMLQNGIEQLIEEADKYLYKGKQNGKNCVSSPFTP